MASLGAGCHKNQATIYGLLPDDAPTTVVTEAVLKSGLAPVGVIARSQEFFSWRKGPSVMMLGYDLRDGHAALQRRRAGRHRFGR